MNLCFEAAFAKDYDAAAAVVGADAAAGALSQYRPCMLDVLPIALAGRWGRCKHNRRSFSCVFDRGFGSDFSLYEISYCLCGCVVVHLRKLTRYVVGIPYARLLYSMLLL